MTMICREQCRHPSAHSLPYIVISILTPVMLTSHVLQIVARPVANPTKQQASNKGKEGDEGAGEFDVAIFVADAVEAEIFLFCSFR